MERSYPILMAARVPYPRKQAQASTTIPYQEWRGNREGGEGLN